MTLESEDANSKLVEVVLLLLLMLMMWILLAEASFDQYLEF